MSLSFTEMGKVAGETMFIQGLVENKFYLNSLSLSHGVQKSRLKVCRKTLDRAWDYLLQRLSSENE